MCTEDHTFFCAFWVWQTINLQAISPEPGLCSLHNLLQFLGRLLFPTTSPPTEDTPQQDDPLISLAAAPTTKPPPNDIAPTDGLTQMEVEGHTTIL